MTITFTGPDAAAKRARAIADIETIRGKFPGQGPTDEQLSQVIEQYLDSKGLKHSNENEALLNLRNATIQSIFSKDNGKQGYDLMHILWYQGFIPKLGSAPVEKDGPKVAGEIAAAMPGFIAKHPELANMPAKDIYAKVSDTLWTDKPDTAVTAKSHDDYSGIEESLGDDYSKQIRATAEATFGKENIQKIQMQLYLRHPGYKRPDGEWTIEDQKQLIDFINQENKNRYSQNPIPSPVEMRWGPENRQYISSRIQTALINSEVGWAQANIGKIDRNTVVVPPTDANGSSNPNKIQLMQLYLKLGGYYKKSGAGDDASEVPTGIWTDKDRRALQSYLDDPSHHRNGFQQFFGMDASALPEKAEGLNGAEFDKILNYIVDEVGDRKGVSRDVATAACVDVTKYVADLPIRPGTVVPGQTVPPKIEVTKPPVVQNPAPVVSSEPTHGADYIENADGARLLAQLHVMGAYNGKFTGADGDVNGALRAYAKSHPELKISGDAELSAEQRRIIKDKIRQDWEAWTNNKDNAQKIKDTVDKGDKVEMADGKKHPEVREMQIALLAMGASLPNYGADSSYGRETTDALKAQKAVGGNYRAILDAAKIDHSDWKDDGGTTVTRTDTGPKVDTTSGGFGDLIGAGGFIKPLPEPVAPVVTQPAATANFTRRVEITGQPKDVPASPKVTASDIGTGQSSGMGAYFNSKSNLTPMQQAELHFKSAPEMRSLPDGTPLPNGFILDPNGAERNNYTVYRLLQARDHKDQGQVFVIGPDGRFAERYAYNAGVLTPMKTYDRSNPRDADRFNNDLQDAARKQAVYVPGQSGRVDITPTTLAGVPNDTRGHVMANAQPIVGGVMMAYLTLRNLGVGH